MKQSLYPESHGELMVKETIKKRIFSEPVSLTSTGGVFLLGASLTNAAAQVFFWVQINQ